MQEKNKVKKLKKYFENPEAIQKNSVALKKYFQKKTNAPLVHSEKNEKILRRKSRNKKRTE